MNVANNGETIIVPYKGKVENILSIHKNGIVINR